MERSPVPLYLLFPPYTGALEKLRRRLACESWLQERSWRKRAAKLGFAFAWPLVAALRAFKVTWAHREALRRTFNKPAWQVFLYQWGAAAWYGLPPALFLKNAVFLAKNLSASRFIITNQERAYLVDRLIRRLEKNALEDKFLFFQRCDRAALPCIPILGRFRHGQVEWVAHTPDASEPTYPGLFAKLSADQQGRGALAWKAVSHGHFEAADGAVQTLQLVAETLRQRSAAGSTYLLQPRIQNHPAINDLSPGALATIRLFTIRSLSGEVVPLMAVARMATGRSVTDNFGAGGLAAAIDLQTGVLAAATLKLSPLTALRDHPDTGARIEGRHLPGWPEALKLGLDAHREFSEFFLVGWDIAIAPEGHILVEGNEHPSMDIQFVTRSPLGKTRFVDLAQQWLAATTARTAG